uniref:MFS domain-containing protein n=1 Tax=Steinernema glaseri TaxID=37863 RepID=A0A1I8A661_9BILA
MTSWTLNDIILKCRDNRRILLLIVYIALFLDNMLLTTVVPIIPEYLLRLSHPNSTDMLLYDKVTDTSIAREKRQLEWGDNVWDVPMDPVEPEISWMDNPLLASKYATTTPRPRMRPLKYSKPALSSPSAPRARDLNPEEEALRHKLLAEENVQVGLMFGSKALIQLITNPLIGPLTNKIGYTMPMFAGFCIMFLSTVMFAFGASYPTLWLARALQGIGSACTSTSGMGMLAQAYPDDMERGSAMGIALGGLALGVLVGPPYGGALYTWSGKELPFILLALLALFDGSLQFMVLQPKVDRGEPEGTTIKNLVKDPYIIICAGAITIGNLGIAMLEPSLPLWMMETWQAGSMERGAAFLPASISYLVGTNVFGPLAHKMGRWLSAFIGLVIIGFCLLVIPTARSVGGLIAPHLFMGFSIGMIDASMFPLMGYLVDIRHVGVYGSIYAIADAAFCFAFALGPFFSGPLVRSVGFPTMMYLIAFINFLYAPLMFLLRNPPPIEREKTALFESNGTSNDHYEKIDRGTDDSGAEIRRMEGYQYDY